MKTLKGFLLIMAIILLTNSCHVGRYFYWNVANIDDYKKFENARITPGNTAFEFHKNLKKLSIPPSYSDEKNDTEEFLKNHKSVAFILIQNDTILYENYFSGYDSSSYLTSFSVAKSFVSALTGIAIAEGHIGSVHDKVYQYLPYLDTSRFALLTIEHLLNMRSGIKANEGYYNPFGEVAKFYYGKNLDKYLRKLKKEGEPDVNYAYKSVNTQLLADVVEHATQMPIQVYMEKKLWKPLGMKSNALWSVDSEKNKTVKAFCCLNARALDYARFGRLYLRKGNWQGQQLLPESWIKRSTTILSNNRDSQGYAYTYQWRVTDYGAFFARGIKGQYIFVWPEKNIIALRYGKSYDDIDWARLMKSVIEFNGLK